MMRAIDKLVKQLETLLDESPVNIEWNILRTLSDAIYDVIKAVIVNGQLYDIKQTGVVYTTLTEYQWSEIYDEFMSSLIHCEKYLTEDDDIDWTVEDIKQLLQEEFYVNLDTNK